MFSDSCRDEFFSALELLKDLSSHGFSANRLWKRLRGLKNITPQLGLKPKDELRTQHQQQSVFPAEDATNSALLAHSVVPVGTPHTLYAVGGLERVNRGPWLPTPDANIGYRPSATRSLPDMFQMSDHFTSIFEALENMQDHDDDISYSFQDRSGPPGCGTEISMLFGDLL